MNMGQADCSTCNCADLARLSICLESINRLFNTIDIVTIRIEEGSIWYLKDGKPKAFSPMFEFSSCLA